MLHEVLDKHVPVEAQQLARVRNLWIELFPPGFADHVWPMIVQKHRLILYVHDSQWLHEMTYWRQDVLHKLGIAWPESPITKLEAYVGRLPPMHERRPPPPPEMPPVDRRPVLTPDVPDQTRDALNAVHDPELRDTLARARMMLGTER